MREFHLSVLCALAATVWACASTGVAPPSSNAVPVNGVSARYAFGNVEQGAVIRVEFAVRNTAPYRITVDNVENICGCTTTQLARDIIDPGEAQSLWVTLDTARLWGPQSKTVVVHTDDPLRRTIRVTVEGVVKELLRCEPRRIEAESPAGNVAVAVRVENASDRDLVLKTVAVEPADHVAVDFGDQSLPLRLAAGAGATLNARAELLRPGVRLVGKISLVLEGVGETIQLPFFFERPSEPEPPPKTDEAPASK